MTISNTPRKAGPYAGNGSATTFAFSFKVFSAADVLVVRAVTATGIETTLALNTDYTVSLNADQDTSPGGTITTTTAPATGQTITLSSDMDYTQPVELANNGGFYPSVINAALDRLTIFAQQLAEQVGRAVKTGISSTKTPDEMLAEISDAATASAAAASSAGASATSAADAAAAAAASAAAADVTRVNAVTLQNKTLDTTNKFSRSAQIGSSGTATQNFSLEVPASPDGTMKLARGNAGATTQDIMIVDAAGKVTFPQNKVPAFRARLASSQNLTSGVAAKVNYDTEEFDTDNCFSSGRFTPTEAGYYQINASVYGLTSPGTLASASVSIVRNGTTINTGRDLSTTFTETYVSASTLVYLNGTTDYIEVWATVSGSSPVLPSGQLNNVSGHLVRAA